MADEIDQSVRARLQQLDTEKAAASCSNTDPNKLLNAVRKRRDRKVALRRGIQLSAAVCLLIGVAFAVLKPDGGQVQTTNERRHTPERSRRKPAATTTNNEESLQRELIRIQERVAQLDRLLDGLERVAERQSEIEQRLKSLERDRFRDQLATTDDDVFKVNVAYDFGY